MTAHPTPYCGAPPNPSEILARWNLDPVLIAGLLLAAAAYVISARRFGVVRTRTQSTCFATGWAIAALALVSPLCPLSVSLFSARVSQHMILTLAAAPLVVAGRPFPERAEAHGFGRAWTAAGVFTAMLWLWHSPRFYELTFESTAVYWTMHATMFGSALWLWEELLDPHPRAALNTSMVGLLAAAQMGLLGALITLAPQLLYRAHLNTAWAWGLSPLEDQQLGGAIMWAPGCLTFLVVAAIALWRMLEDPAAPASALRKEGA